MPSTGNNLARAEKVVARCQRLASFTETPGSTCRTFLSAPMRDCHREITSWLHTAGASVTIDAAGNLRGVYPGQQSESPRLILGSHLDTVPNAGAYDGILGVVLAVSLLESLEGRKFPFAIEIIGFSEEEGIRFGMPFIGSRALTGTLDDDVLNRKDKNNISVRTAIENFGLNPREIPQSILKNDTLAYVEFHIEQGPVLESLGIPLGIAESIAGQDRVEFIFLGSANHAGTTPMHLRKDAMAAAAEWVVEVERIAKSEPGLVATVGSFDVVPNAPNVIAGKVRATLDLRHGYDDARAQALAKLIEYAAEVAQRRGVSVQHRALMSQPAVVMDSSLVNQIEGAVKKIGCVPHRMVSGAGHDAMIMARKTPSAMIFLRTPGGVSHHPSESIFVEDVALALECGSTLLDQIASSPEYSKRMCRA
ncbi:MAG: allantoate amidohydrolase [Acidobacteriota bacterium]|nr:allantoate amidohydrolase [Acidobacteriota bacterium]